MELEITPYTKRFEKARSGFACGEPSLDAYLQRQARQDMAKDLAICYILCERGEASILGYYTLSAVSVLLQELPPETAKTAGRYQQVPAVILGRLAVDARTQRQGYGELLLMDALRNAARTGVGVKLLIVDALHERAADFYARYGFQRLPDTPSRLFLPLATARELFGESGEVSTP